MASSKFTQAVESYFTELRLVRGSGGATNERSLYVLLANLLNAVGGGRCAQAQGVLRSGAGRSGCRSSRLRPLCEPAARRKGSRGLGRT